MTTINDIKQQRGFTEQQLEDAKKIVDEINHASAFPEEFPELTKYGTMGYMAPIGSPHQWWQEHSDAYREIEVKYKRDRDLHTVCLLADALLASNPTKLDDMGYKGQNERTY